MGRGRPIGSPLRLNESGTSLGKGAVVIQENAVDYHPEGRLT
jgi:hypothetical protein